MRKYFKNSIQKREKRKGFSVLVCAIGLTLTLGMMTGCSVSEPVVYETQTEEELPDRQVPETDYSGEETGNIKPEDEKPAEEALSEDGREIKEIAEKFAAAYFSGDTDTVKSCLTSPYEWKVETYTAAGTISNLTWKGITEAGEEEIGTVKVISMEYKDSSNEDTFQYLTLEFVKQQEGWKIQFYGIE